MSTETEERLINLSAPANTSFCEPQAAMQCLFGESLLMIASTREQAKAKRASIAPSSETKARSNHQTLYGRQWKSLLTAGMIAGITPMSIRKRLGADCRETALFPQDGDTSDIEDIE